MFGFYHLYRESVIEIDLIDLPMLSVGQICYDLDLINKLRGKLCLNVKTNRISASKFKW
ncbi:MAG: hypothetical protein ACTJGH_04770 [Peptoniphilaceae bacterium]